MEPFGFTMEFLCPKDAEGMANSVDPDQTAPLGAVWSGSSMFSQQFLSQNLTFYGILNELYVALI